MQGGETRGVVTTIIGIMDPTTPMCDPRHHSPARTGVRAIGRSPPTWTPPTPTRFGQVVWVDVWVRGREAPGRSGPGGPWYNTTRRGGKGVFTKRPSPVYFIPRGTARYIQVPLDLGIPWEQKRRAHLPMVPVVGDQKERCVIETAPLGFVR